jgi:hypothetical protein
VPGYDPEFGDRGLMQYWILRKTASRSLPTDTRPVPVIEIVVGVMW